MSKAVAKKAPEPTENDGKRQTPQVLKAELKDGSLKLSVDEAQKGQRGDMAAFGSESGAFQSYAISQVLRILGAGKPHSEDVTFDMNAALAMLSGIAPQDEQEAMLAAQMVATHHLAMGQLNRHAYADDLRQHEVHANLGNKFLRTFAMQMEALAKLRRGGEQVVKYVHVHEGGQAVVAGTINQRGGA
jgi:hypothetical protein